MKNIFCNNATETMTVKELIDLLKNFPDDMAVVATWEGQVKEIDPLKFRVVSEYLSPLIEPVLEIDVEY